MHLQPSPLHSIEEVQSPSNRCCSNDHQSFVFEAFSGTTHSHILTLADMARLYGQHQSCDIFSCIYILYLAYGWDNIILGIFLIIYIGQTLLSTLSSNPVKHKLYIFLS